MNPNRVRFGLIMVAMVLATLVFASIPGLGTVALVSGLGAGVCLLMVWKG